MATQTRPLGIVLIVIFFAIFGVLGSLGGACAMMAGGAMQQMMESGRHMGDQTAGAMAGMPGMGMGWMLLSLVGIVAAILEIAAAYGLWSFQRWGRPLGLYLAAFAIAWGLFLQLAIGGGLGGGGIYATAWSLLMLAVHAAILWYLRTPEIVTLYDRPPA